MTEPPTRKSDLRSLAVIIAVVVLALFSGPVVIAVGTAVIGFVGRLFSS